MCHGVIREIKYVNKGDVHRVVLFPAEVVPPVDFPLAGKVRVTVRVSQSSNPVILGWVVQHHRLKVQTVVDIPEGQGV